MKQKVIIQDSTGDAAQWLQFSEPVEIVCAARQKDVCSSLQRIEKAVDQGLYAAGFLSYEAATALDAALLTHKLNDFPYLWFGLYEECKPLSALPIMEGLDYELSAWRQSLSWPSYASAIARVKHHIREGDSYQINYTHKLHSKFEGDSWAFFLDLYKAQKPQYSAYIDMGRYQVLSVSPELFIRLNDNRLLSKPMKGTVERGLSSKQDKDKVDWLRNSDKNRAENLMIVDMVRNDMGRIAATGSVQVSNLFDVESFPTVNQMTSSVEATTAEPISKILTAMFPCASVTGAPKAKTMELIRSIESQARGIYTGSIGFMKPNRQAQFNVAIRTVLIDSDIGTAEYGVGGGIVWDSEAQSEFAECKTKANVLTRIMPDFDLLESLLWKPGEGYWLLEGHISRLQASAEYFNFEFSQTQLMKQLKKTASKLNAPSKVRLLLNQKGEISIEHSPLDSLAGLTVGLSAQACDTQTPYCYHKTTYRKLYQHALHCHPDYDDVILVNQEGYITESTMANVVVEIDGKLLTPAVSCGLLAGTYRQDLLKSGFLQEANLTSQQILNAAKLYLINSVRGPLLLKKVGEGLWQIQQSHMSLHLECGSNSE